MDLTTAKWLSELEADDPSFIQHWLTENICCDPLRVNNNNIISFGESTTTTIMDQLIIKEETTTTDVMCNGETINFHHTAADFLTHGKIYVSPPPPVDKYSVNRTPLQAQDHILAERKRRHKLTQQFIALSAIVPGLNKLDKASVLGGAIKYLKELEEKQQALEIETKRRQHQDSSVVSSKRPRPSSSSYDDHDTSSSDVDFEGGGPDQDRMSPEIQVRISGDNVLLRIYCCNINGIMNEMLREIEKLPISVTSSNAMPFGNTTLCVTIIAQIDGDSGMTAQELARNIREVVVKLV